MFSRTCIIAGTDEVGRGPLAGPVVAAAAILNNEQRLVLLNEGLRDSKKMTHKVRERLFIRICELGVIWTAQAASPGKIDIINIFQASLWCMKRSIEKLPLAPDLVLVDGDKNIPDLAIRQKCIVKGDDKVPAIAAASVIAKTLRDRAMIILDRIYPDYEFARHKGYPTAKHREVLLSIGASPVHRFSFKGVLLVETHDS